MTFHIGIQVDAVVGYAVERVFAERWEADRDEAACRQGLVGILKSVEVSESELEPTHEWVEDVGCVKFGDVYPQLTLGALGEHHYVFRSPGSELYVKVDQTVNFGDLLVQVGAPSITFSHLHVTHSDAKLYARLLEAALETCEILSSN